MKNEIIPIGLGSGKVSQFSISENVNQNKIESLLCDNLKRLEEYTNKLADPYAEKLIENLKNNKKLLFTINKHLEIYINNNKDNLQKIFKYIVFRYKFLETGKKKN